MRFAIENPVSPLLDAPVVYRPARSGWAHIAVGLVFVAAIFAFVSLPWLNMGALTAEEIKKQHIESYMPLIWLAFALGALLLIFLVTEVWSLLFFQVVADHHGLRWRPFIAWRSARWSEVTDCVLPKPKTPGNARIVLGKRRVSLDPKNPDWPTLCDFVAARVALPGNIEPWHLPLPEDAEARRAQSDKADDGAPIRTSSNVWPLLIFGGVATALLGAMFQFVVNNDPNPNPSNQRFVWAILAFCVATLIFPLLMHWRSYVVADDEGLLIARILRRRRIGWEQIEDMFLLSGARDDRAVWVSAYVVVAGQNIYLEHLGRERDAILNRIEARAFNSRSPTFQARDDLPVGAALPLPATLHARDGMRAWKRQSALSAVCFAAVLAGTLALVLDIGWDNFGTSRAILLLGALGYAAVCALWARRAFREWRVVRGYGDVGLEVDETGLSWRKEAETVRIEWARVVSLTRDDRGAIGTASFRVEAADGASLVWDSWWPRAFRVAALAQEKCAVESELSRRTQLYRHGITRDGESFRLSNNTPLARTTVWLMAGFWATCSILPSIELSAREWVGLLFAPFPGVLLYGALFYWWRLRRVWVRCDARGLHYRGLWRERFMAWDDVEAYGASVWRDWVRARDGQTIRIQRVPSSSVTWAQTQLREEIVRCAPHAQGDWARS